MRLDVNVREVLMVNVEGSINGECYFLFRLKSVGINSLTKPLFNKLF